MPLSTVYITVVWIPGGLAFSNKTRRIFDTSVTTPETLAMEMVEDKATILKRKTMTQDSLQSIMSDMYYEIYSSPEARKPFSKSANAPE